MSKLIFIMSKKLTWIYVIIILKSRCFASVTLRVARFYCLQVYRRKTNSTALQIYDTIMNKYIGGLTYAETILYYGNLHT